MSNLIRILLVEDDQEDQEITEKLLEQIDEFSHKTTWAQNTNAGNEALKNETFDVCLVDYYIGGETGMDFIREAKLLTPHMPFILLTGRGGHDIDIEAMHAGASDYLQKNGLSSEILERAIRYAMTNASIRHDLHHQSLLLQATLDNAQSAIAAIDRNDKLIAWNDLLLSILENYQHEKNQDTPPEPIKHGIILKKYFPIFDDIPNEYVSPDKEIYEIYKSKLQDGGKVISFINVTHRKKAEETLRKAAEEAEATSRAKSVFFANISHELRTPLNIIIGFSELLLNTQSNENKQNSKLSNYISHIYNSAQTLLKVIEATIDLTRMQAGNYTLNIEPVHVPFLLQKSVREMQNLAQKKSVQIEIETEADIENTLYIMGDIDALAKLLKHVLSNAIKFSPNEKNISIKAKAIGENVEICVIDHGIGMHPQDIERAFSPFGQLDDSLSKRYSGIGLGLPIARALTLLHKGELTLESAQGKGTSAKILLPAPTKEKTIEEEIDIKMEPKKIENDPQKKLQQETLQQEKPQMEKSNETLNGTQIINAK